MRYENADTNFCATPLSYPLLRSFSFQKVKKNMSFEMPTLDVVVMASSLNL